MSIQPLLAKIEESCLKSELPEIHIGDTVDVHVKILEGDKERTQIFTGLVIARRGRGASETFTVRRLVNGEGVERIFPIHSPRVANIEVKKKAIVRRAKLYYLRDRIGSKAMNLKERIIKKETTGRARTRVKARRQKKADAAAKGEVAPAKTRKSRKKASPKSP